MRKFIFMVSAVLVVCYAILFLISKMVDHSNHQEYLSFMEEMNRNSDELGI